ncbi:hypothetical protein [Raineyella sp. W15-4]|uniref:hypothetical protein n=1 Tax=Raineyella sp. W15-4 TaxID=3081651 RepID=UPI00295402C8|nr:hypothetical protein [Raineyella sp. W15-4]WOQ18372.1 hypothetical protein R0145_06720 [Raineyella sp. W15-4]
MVGAEVAGLPGWWPWLVAAVIVIVLAVVASRSGARRDPDDRLDEADEREIDEMFALVDAEADAPVPSGPLCATVERLIARSVPLRDVRPAARASVGRLVFADSTVLLIGQLTVDTIALARAVVAGPVVVASYEPDDRGVRLVLRWRSGSAEIRVVGFDQPD